jgi:hypothetical protein
VLKHFIGDKLTTNKEYFKKEIRVKKLCYHQIKYQQKIVLSPVFHLFFYDHKFVRLPIKRTLDIVPHFLLQKVSVRKLNKSFGTK